MMYRLAGTVTQMLQMAGIMTLLIILAGTK